MVRGSKRPQAYCLNRGKQIKLERNGKGHVGNNKRGTGGQINNSKTNECKEYLKK